MPPAANTAVVILKIRSPAFTSPAACNQARSRRGPRFGLPTPRGVAAATFPRFNRYFPGSRGPLPVRRLLSFPSIRATTSTGRGA